MKQLEGLDGRRRAVVEVRFGRGKAAPGDRAARAFGEDVGAAHRAKIGDETHVLSTTAYAPG